MGAYVCYNAGQFKYITCTKKYVRISCYMGGSANI